MLRKRHETFLIKRYICKNITIYKNELYNIYMNKIVFVWEIECRRKNDG